MARATARDGVEEEAVRKRIAAQLSNDERRAKADIVINNSGDEAALLAHPGVQSCAVIGLPECHRWL